MDIQPDCYTLVVRFISGYRCCVLSDRPVASGDKRQARLVLRPASQGSSMAEAFASGHLPEATGMFTLLGLRATRTGDLP